MSRVPNARASKVGPLLLLTGILVVFSSTDRVGAQDVPAPPDSSNAVLRVFLDCQTFQCEEEYVRQRVTYVDYVRDPSDANVHVLVTTQGTGGGGTEFTLTFLGRERFRGRRDTLIYVSSERDTREETRRGVVRVYEAGLMPFVSQTPLLGRIDVSVGAGRGGERRTTPEEDPWDYWVYEVGVSGFFNGEQQQDRLNLSGNVSANRTTREWKIDLDGGARYSESNFEVEGETITDVQRNYDVGALVVRSLSEHWSIGGSANVRHSTFRNVDLSVRASPAIEYNVFPYSVSTRRQLRILYELQPVHYDYERKTIFERTSETRLEESLEATLELNETWGSVETSVEASHYFYDLSRNNLQVSANLNLRIVRGLSLNLFGNLSVIQNQLNLPAGEATKEEILLRRRELATDYRYFGRIGLSYTFGSIYNNVVNPRFGGGGGDR